MRLHQYGVNLFEFDGATLVANGFEQRGQAEVACGAQVAFGALQDQVDRLFSEHGLGHADGFELGMDECLQVFGRQWFEFSGPGDAAVYVCVDAEPEFVAQTGMGDEDEVVIFGEVFQ